MQNSCLSTVLERVLTESRSLIDAHQLNITVTNLNNIKPKVMMLNEVLEIIFHNLINNVIHHGKQHDGMLKLMVNISEHEITFGNEQASEISEEQYFSLGLKLIGKLSERFNNNFKTTIINYQYTASLSYW
jgi:light-regulated signal transduction histidine kinase (bacteriophytochrome)